MKVRCPRARRPTQFVEREEALMPSRFRHTGADFTPAISSPTCIFRHIIQGKRLIARVVLGTGCLALPSLARAQTTAEEPAPNAPSASAAREKSSEPATESGEAAPNAPNATDGPGLASGDPSAPAPVAPVASVPAPPTVVSPAAPIEITVQGEVPPNAGSKLREPLRDVPSTVNTVTAKTLRERATTDLVEALRNVAGVNPIL